MRFTELTVPGAYVMDLEPHHDDRGFFARTFARDELSAHGLATDFPQCNLSRNHRLGTLRGMHYAVAPSAEVKIVRCVTGAIYDVIVDVRRDARVFGAWTFVELSADNGRALYIPPGVAHGFLTLADASDVFYHMGETYHPDRQRGFRWNDPTFGIAWPAAPVVIAERDAAYADFQSTDTAPAGA